MIEKKSCQQSHKDQLKRLSARTCDTRTRQTHMSTSSEAIAATKPINAATSKERENSPGHLAGDNDLALRPVDHERRRRRHEWEGITLPSPHPRPRYAY